MMFQTYNQNIHLGDKVITLEAGFLAIQSDGSVVARCGDTVVLCTVCSAKEDDPEADFFPLTVNYIEKAYACGKIPGGFYKREGKQSEREILISRLIDRPLRPIFANGFYRNTQVVCTLLSYDEVNSPDIVALIGSSAAVALAGMPIKGIISGCRVGYVNGKYIINPTIEEMKDSKLDIVVAGTTDAVLMVESEAKLLTEDEMLGAIEVAQQQINSSVEEIKQFIEKVGKKSDINFIPRDRTKLYEKVEGMIRQKLVEAFKVRDKRERHRLMNDIFAELKDKMDEELCSCCCCEENCENKNDSLVSQDGKPVEMNDIDLKLVYEDLLRNIVRTQILRDKIRIDGRQLDEIRPIEVRVGVLPRVHGSAVFSRGMTQSLAVATLGGSDDEQIPDSLTDTRSGQRFLLHYNFPGYSAGEPSPLKAPGRRELGHGNLARRALTPVIPSKEEFPYTIRVVSEITSSDGSTSQATVCSCCMAMMDMGVPLKAPVAGVAMGLIKEPEGYTVLTDIMADEDHLGDMDFKVAGTKDGITALQMDIKIFGITLEIMKDALAQAKKARIHIMSKMMEALPAPRASLNENAPKIFNLKLTEEQIPDLIGKSGATIKKICEEANVKIDIKDGVATIFANKNDDLEKAIDMVNSALGRIEFGKIFDATVKSVLSFGAIVDIGYNRTGLVHISELSDNEIEPSAILVEGQNVKVKYVGNDEKGRFKFSIKAVDQTTGNDKGYFYEENTNREEKNDKPYRAKERVKKYDRRDKRYHGNSNYSHFDKKKDKKKKKKFLFF